MSQYGQVTKRHTFHDFAKLVFCLHTAGTENPDTPQTHPSASNFHEYQSEHPQTPPRHPPDTPQTAPGNTTCQQRTTDANRHHQTYSNSTSQCLWVSGSVWQCLLASVGVCWHVMFPEDALGVSGGCLGGVWGHLSGIHLNQRRLDVFGGYLGSQSLQYGAKILIWQSPERYDFLSPNHTETLKYQNLPMYPFQKWLSYAIFCIF